MAALVRLVEEPGLRARFRRETSSELEDDHYDEEESN